MYTRISGKTYKQRYSLLLLSIAICSIVFLVKMFWISSGDSGLPTVILAEFERNDLENGDLIFRRALGAGSDYILSVDSNSSYSHIGIIHKKEQKITVIHASTDSGKLGAYVHEDDLDNFLTGVSVAAVYRTKPYDSKIADHAVEDAISMIGLPFDAKLDLNTSDTVYCTELVWRAYRHSGIDLLNGHFDYLNLPILGSGFYILPSSLAQSRWVILIKTYHNQ